MSLVQVGLLCVHTSAFPLGFSVCSLRKRRQAQTWGGGGGKPWMYLLLAVYSQESSLAPLSLCIHIQIKDDNNNYPIGLLSSSTLITYKKCIKSIPSANTQYMRVITCQDTKTSKGWSALSFLPNSPKKILLLQAQSSLWPANNPGNAQAAKRLHGGKWSLLVMAKDHLRSPEHRAGLSTRLAGSQSCS